MQASSVPAQAPAPAPAQAPPQLPAAPGRATVSVTNADGTAQTLAIPLTKQDVAALQSRREELSSQLISAARRRRELSKELQGQPAGPARAGIEGRLAVLDTRLAQLETDISTTGRQLSAAPEGLLSSQENPWSGDIPDNVAAVSGAFILFVLFPIALAHTKRMWRNAGRASPSQADAASANRLERLEHGVEAIAIEIERVSEGQRFITRLLSEAAPGGKLGAVSQHQERLGERSEPV